MRFCDKLSKLRKSNNLSQEQLADRLGVSRQAVSKWESGTSYPDMDKIIQLCNILDCTLEDIMDDGTINSNKSNNNKVNINSYLQDLLSFITKSSNMLNSMTFKERTKCIFEMLLIIFFMFLLGGLLFTIVNSITNNILSLIPFSIREYISNITQTLYFIGIFILGIIIILHLFKIRYLDYFITIEDKNIKEKVIEEDIEKKENKYYVAKEKEKIIIRDPKHTTFSFFSLLGKIITFIIKIFTIIFVIPVIFLFLLLTAFSAITIYHTIYSYLFLWIGISLLGASSICYLVIYFVYNFIFNRKIAFKKSFIIFIISLIVISLGVGLSFVILLNYNYIDNYNDLDKITDTVYIDMMDNTYIGNIEDIDTEYIIDNNLTNIKVEVTYIKGLKYSTRTYKYNNSNYYYFYLDEFNIKNIYNLIMNDFKNKNIRNYDNDNMLNIKIYLSQENYEKLMKNSDYE